jgi:hypothetical protein
MSYEMRQEKDGVLLQNPQGSSTWRLFSTIREERNPPGLFHQVNHSYDKRGKNV